jgi:ADP-ribose pyrophosphatase YjhB (NUDIX family)
LPIAKGKIEMKSDKKAFTLRVYGLLINAHQEVLIAEETHKSRYMIKFPGGGLQWGEGIADCLVREFKEELDLDVSVGNHFYTTDFYVASAFDPQIQLISIYYEVHAAISFRPKLKTLDRTSEEDETFYFTPISSLEPAEFFTFPVDQHVGQLLKTRHLNGLL